MNLQELPTGARVRVSDALEPFLAGTLATWAGGGSIVLLRNTLGDQTDRLAAERVTVDLTEERVTE